MTSQPEALIRVATRLHEEMTVEAVTEAILEGLSRELQLGSALLYSASGDALQLTSTWGGEVSSFPSSVSLEAACLVAEVARERKRKVVSGPQPSASGSDCFCKLARLGALAAVPLVAFDRLVGVLIGVRSATFKAGELQLLSTVAGVCAVSLQNAQAFERELWLRRELERHRSHLSMAQEIAQLGSWDWDVRADRVSWSETMFRMHGVDPSAPLDFDRIQQLIHPEDRERVLGAITAALDRAHEGRFGLDHRLIRDGEVRHVHLAGRVTFDERGRPLRVIGTTLDITERVNAQEACRRSEESVKLVFEHAPIGTAMVGLDGQLLRVNQALADLLGFSTDELVHKRLQDITERDDLRPCAPCLPDLLNGYADRVRLSKRLVHKSGRRVDVVLHGAVVRGADGKVLHLVVQVENVSELQQVQDELQRAVDELRSLLEHIPDGMFVLDGERLAYANPALAQMLGAEPHAVAERSLIEWIHPDERESMRALMLAPPEGAGSSRVVRLLRRDGSVLEAEVKLSRVRQQDRSRVLGVARDVTSREQARRARERLIEELATRRRWLEQALDRLPIGVLLGERRERVRIWGNRYAQRLLGRTLSPDQGQEQYLGQVCDLSGRPLPLEGLASSRVLRGESVVDEDLLVRRPDGSVVAIRASGEALRNEDGEIVGGVGVFEDVTQLRNVERMREEWMSIIAHDLRQPVMTVMAYAGLLRRTLDDPGAAAKLVHVEAAARRLQRMIDDLLDVSRLEAHRLELRPEPLELRALLRGVAERVGATFQGQEVELELFDDLPTVTVDAGRLEQVLENLLTNARKYGEADTPIVLGAKRQGASVLVWVRNHGRGIPPEGIPHVFSRFHREPGARQHGMGLGLYITRGLVEAHGGRIWVESTPGEHTTFFFTLPLQRGDA